MWWENLQEKTRAAAAPRNPKKGAVSSPLNVEDMISDPNHENSTAGIQILDLSLQKCVIGVETANMIARDWDNW